MSISKEVIETINADSATLLELYGDRKGWEDSAPTEDTLLLKPLGVTREEGLHIYDRRIRRVESRLKEHGVGAVIKADGKIADAQEAKRADAIGLK